MSHPALDRRRLLKAAALGLVATACGCSREAPAPGQAARTPASPSRSPRPSPLLSPLPSPTPALPAAARWTPSPRETLPGLKQAAADVAQALCSRAPGESVADALTRIEGLLTPQLDQAGALRVLAPVSEGTASSGQVVYPQLGGLAPLRSDAREACVMVVVRQALLSPGGAVGTVTRVLDLRLSREGEAWRLSAVPDAGGEPVDRPATLAASAVRVLDDPRIELPDTARWDIHAGRVAPALLDVLTAAAELGQVGVTVLATGHPRHVFGTDRVSAHSVGRAVDVWRVGTTAVVDDRSPGGPAAQLQALALLDRQVSQVGSPPGTDQDGRGRRSFDDLVHEDHLHLAVRR